MKQDLNGVRTPNDVMRRLADNVKITSDKVEGLTIEVSKKVGDEEIISKINQSPEAITLDANKININGVVSANGNFRIDEQGNMECNNAKIKGRTLDINSPQGDSTILITNLGAEDVGDYVNEISGSGQTIRVGNVPTYIVESYGNEWYAFGRCSRVYVGSEYGGEITLEGSDGIIYANGLEIAWKDSQDPNDKTTIQGGNVTCTDLYYDTLHPSSLEEKKKDFEKLESGLEIVKDTEIYKYHFKKENETDKKHIGFVIGDNFKYRKELTDTNNKGVDLYAMTSVLWRAVQEQQEEIEKLKEVRNDKSR